MNACLIAVNPRIFGNVRVALSTLVEYLTHRTAA